MGFVLPLQPGDLTFTWDDVLGIAPELSVVTPHQVTMVINTCGDEVTVANWGTQERANRAGLWYAAHVGTGFRLGMASPAITEVAVGQVRKGYRKSDNGFVLPLEMTAYGREYLRMVRLWLPRFSLGA